MFKFSSVTAMLIASLIITQPAKADVSKTQTWENRVVVKEMVAGQEHTRCPNGGKSCVVTVTLHDNGGFSSTVTEASAVPDPLDPTYPLDPTDYIEGTNDLNIILDRICDDLILGEGVPVLP